MKRIQSFAKMLFYICALFAIVTAVTSVNATDVMSCLFISSLVTVGVIGLAFTVKKTKTGGVVTNEFLEGLCEKIQTSMINTFKSNAPELRRTKVGYTQAITSPQNTTGISQIPIDPGNGKKKLVRITGIVRGCEDDITDEVTDDCSTELEKEPWEDTIEVTNTIATKGIKFTEDEMRKLCETDEMWMSQVVNSYLDPLVKKLNKNLITEQLANFGAFPGGALSPMEVYLLTANPNAMPIYKGEADILDVFENSDMTGKPIVIGGGKLGTYIREIGIGCCNDGGLNLAEAGNLDFFRDRFVEGIVGADQFIGLAPGMVQLLTWNKYVGPYKKQNDVFSHGTIVDPFTGLMFDIKWHYNDCNDTYSLQIFLNYEMFFLPTKAWAYCDELVGNNGTFRFKAKQA